MKSFFIPGTLPLVLGLGTTCTIGYGTILYSFSLLSLEIEKAFSWSGEFIYGVYSLGILLSSFVAPRIGKTLDKYGARIPMCVGSVLVAVSLLGQAYMNSKTEFILFLLLMEMVSILVIYESAFVALTQATGKQSRKPISQITLIAGFASTIFWPVISELLNHTDWRHVYIFMAILHILICLPLHWLVLNRQSWQIGKQEIAEKHYQSGTSLHDNQTEILVAVAFGIAAFCIVGMQIHIFGLLNQLHISEKLAIVAGSLIGPFQVLSRFTDMFLGRYISASQLGYVSVSMMTVGLLFTIVSGLLSPYAVFLFAVFFGMGQGLTNIVRGALPLQLFGELNYGAITGRMNRIRLIMTAIAPVTFAVIIKQLGAVQVLVLLTILCALSIAMLYKAKQRHDVLVYMHHSSIKTNDQAIQRR